jgi:serine phosphatase RsbU (regulator of sigma subunit)
VVSRAAIGRVTRVLSVQVVAPIFDKQKTMIGFTCSSVDLGKIANQIKQSARGIPAGRIVVIDSAGQLIADSEGKYGDDLVHENNSALFAPVTSAGEVRQGVDEQHRQVRGAAVGLPEPVLGWRAIAIVPEATIEANARRMMVETATVAVVLSLILLGIAAWLAEWISRPLRTLAATTVAISQGEYSTLPGGLRGLPHEMAQLTFSVRNMISKLRRHARELESEVAARTESLSHANKELTRAIATIRENEDLLREDIANARLFQEKMLPTIPERTDLEFATYYRPLQQISGDIFDVAEISGSHVRVLVADATGHGVQASMRTILLKSIYDRLKHHYAGASTTLEALNETLVQQFPDGDLHCTATCVDLQITNRGVDVVYANAANGPVYLFTPEAPAFEWYEAGPLLGVDVAEIATLAPQTMKPGQLLLIASDGLFEQSNVRRERFEIELRRMVLDASETAEGFSKRLVSSFNDFRREQPVGDDITFIVVRYKRT